KRFHQRLLGVVDILEGFVEEIVEGFFLFGRHDLLRGSRLWRTIRSDTKGFLTDPGYGSFHSPESFLADPNEDHSHRADSPVGSLGPRRATTEGRSWCRRHARHPAGAGRHGQRLDRLGRGIRPRRDAGDDRGAEEGGGAAGRGPWGKRHRRGGGGARGPPQRNVTQRTGGV